MKFLIYLSAKINKFKDPYREGSWYGNDTISRTVTDLNYIVNFINKEGELSDSIPQRKVLTIQMASFLGKGMGH